MSQEEVPIQWLSRDPRNGNVVPYTEADTLRIEKSYQQNPKGSYGISLGGMQFTIDFPTMTQKNSTGGSRQVIRRAAHSVPKTPAGDQLTLIVKEISPTTILKAEEAINANEQFCAAVSENLKLLKHTYQKTGTDSISVEELQASAKVDAQPVVEILNAILKLMTVDNLSASDVNFNDKDTYERVADLTSIGVGEPVPPYFANSKGEGIFRRKYLSLLGLRNLCLHGPEIFSELSWTLFSSNPKAYKDGSGVVKMKQLTGNAVDLDTVVLNCGTQLKEINEIRRKEKKTLFNDAQSFFASEDAKKMAYHQAEALLQTFIQSFGLDKKCIKSRKLELDVAADIPVATNNDQRGMWPVWGYANVGVYTYHANVPHMPDVIGALLRAPFQLAKAFIMCLRCSNVLPNSLEGSQGLNLEGMKELRKLLASFFDEAVNDSCFNAKWKAIEAFVDKMSNVDSIDMVISNLQAANQDVFTQKLFDQDDKQRSHELQELIKLVNGKGIQGRDPKTHQIRLICKQDLEEWIKKTN